MKMTNMSRNSLWLLLGVASCTLHASISVNSSVNDVALGGTHELAGGYSLIIEGDAFPGASPAAPIFIRLAFDKQVVFSQTRVDLNSADDMVSRPIYAPLLLAGDTSDLTLQAPPTTAAIVRWVAGENAIWLRIQSDSATWVQATGGGASAPTANCPVQILFGASARASAELIEHIPESRRNLPFHTRFPEKQTLSAADAVSNLFCIDLTETDAAVVAQDPLLYLIPLAYGPEAETSPGVFEPDPFLPEINFTGVLSIARVHRRSCDIRTLGPLPTILLNDPMAETVAAIANSLSLNISRRQVNDVFNLSLHNGSRLILSTGGRGPYGFAGDAGQFLDPTHAGVVSLSDPFNLDGQIVYQTLVLTWQGGSRILTDFQLDTEAVLYTLWSNAPQDLILDWRLELMNHPGAEDLPPFDGPDQLALCPQSAAWSSEGLWHFGSVGAVFASDRMAPHLTRPLGQFLTDITLANLDGAAPSGCLMTAYNQDGQPVSSIHRILASAETVQTSPQDLFGVPDAAYVAVLEAPAVEVGLVYRADREHVGLAHLRASEIRANVWRLYPGQPELTWDGVALVNLGDDMAEITAVQIRFDGREADRRTISEALAPGEKALYVLSDAFDYLGDAYFQIESSQPLGLIALRGDLDSTLLWENPVIPVE